MIKNYISLRLLISGLCLSFSPLLFAAELKFTTLEVAPWAYKNEGDSQYQGIFPELVDEIERLSGHKINVSLTPYARINRELESGRQDCTILVTDEERAKVVQIGELLFDHPVGVIAHHSVKLDNYDDLLGLRISLLRGSVISKRFNADENLKKEFDTDYVISLKKLQHRRLDAIAGALPTIQYLANQNDMAGLLGEPLQLSSEPIYFQCSKNSKQLQYMEDINAAIREIKETGTLFKILQNNE